MVKVSASEVNRLRKTTGAGMMDCKKALVEAEGNFEKAIELLRKKGQKIAAKRADKDNEEGAVIAKVNPNKTKGVIISVNCETDFVAKNDSFIALANELAEKALLFNTQEEFLTADIDGISVLEKLVEQTGVIGEKIEIKAFETLEAPVVSAYIHTGNQIASLVGLSTDGENAPEIAREVAMQVAAMSPVALDETSVAQEIIDKEIDIAKDQLRKEGKPEAILEKIAQGKLQRFFKDNTLIHQAFIKDSKQSVADYVRNVLGKEAKVTAYKRVALK